MPDNIFVFARNSARFTVLCSLILSSLLVSDVGRAEAQEVRRFSCETPISVPENVRDAYEKHFQCTEVVFDAWFRQYPAEIEQLESLYKAWQDSRTHDLRGQKAAGQWNQQYPVEFSTKRVELSPDQVLEIGPTQSGEPVRVRGEFERLFVDRDNRRLFLTSKEEGLVSISIAARYAFEFEGKVGQSGARDFFVVDKDTALIEEPNLRGGNRDLVVLDISNRSAPREIARLRGAVPEMGGAMKFQASMMESAPTFEQYRAIREGEMSEASCGARPRVKNKPRARCRPDGSCFERKVIGKPEGGCMPVMILPRQSPRSISQSAPGTESKKMAAPRETVSEDLFDDTTMEGGEGGAGSLSQMMVYGKTLYVLSGARSNKHGYLTTFDLSDRKSPRIRQVIQLDNGPEALQRHDSLLLIAGRSGVMTASLGIESQPRLLGEFRQNCWVRRDPIVVQGAIGYRTIVTQGGRDDCGSRLEVIDLSQPHKPRLRSTYSFRRPRGLSVHGDRLFVADEKKGVVVFDIENPIRPKIVGTWRLAGVKDLVLSGFDLYAMSGSEIRTFYVGPLYERGKKAAAAFKQIEGIQTVVSVSNDVAHDRKR